ncbi:MAG: FAD-dependent oxidoreductase, partial [Candidatus Aenigmatarchaeota archaeon]
GGGNSALDAALLLSKIASKVYLIHRRDEFRGFEAFVEEVKKKKNVELLLSSVVREIKGEGKVGSIVVENLKTGEKKEIAVDGIFIEIGYEVDPSLVKDLVKLDEYNQIVVDANCRTFYPDSEKVRPGIFAAGDVTNVIFKQIVVAAGEGAKAALAAYNYLHGVEDVQMVGDWKK